MNEERSILCHQSYAGKVEIIAVKPEFGGFLPKSG